MTGQYTHFNISSGSPLLAFGLRFPMIDVAGQFSACFGLECREYISIHFARGSTGSQTVRDLS